MNKVKSSQNKDEVVERPNDIQALQFLDNVASRAPADRQTHVQVQAAVQQLTKALNKTQEKE